MIPLNLAYSQTLANSTLPVHEIDSPQKQIKSGIPIEDVKCKQGFQLMIRNGNGHPACVKPYTATRLLAHGWITLEKFETIHPITSTQNGTNTISNQITTNNETSSTQDQSVRVFNMDDNSTLSIIPKVTQVVPGIIKPLSIGISSYPLKVGDTPYFILTYEGISENPYYVAGGCRATSTFSTISPSDHVVEKPRPLLMCADYQEKIEPNKIINAYPHTKTNGYYQITKDGLLNVNFDLYVTDQKTGWTLVETIQFDVNVIQ